jgi:transcriptional regulator with XRE-family HTH domain
MPRKPTFGAHIRNARVKRKLSVAEVAVQVGVSQAAIYLWETDRSRPRDANLSALSKALRLPLRAMREMAGR